jgi:curved DNA-binding protein CbpA
MDPRAVLGVSPTATEEEIRAAYLLKVKEFPPDRSPEQFERIRDAYQMVRDARQRARHLLFAADPGVPLASLVAGHPRLRQFVGPQPWLDVLKRT